VVGHPCNGGANQQFALQPTGEITVYDGALCLDVWMAQANDGDRVVAHTCNGGRNQKWVRTANGELQTALNGKCLDVWLAQPTAGARLAVYGCHGGANQKWTVNDAGGSDVGVDTASVGGAAELPRAYVDTRMPARTGRTINVSAGSNLQAALDAAAPGDEVVVEAGATFVGNFVLRPKGNAAGQWITVRSSGSLPGEGTRVSPENAGEMPKLLTPNVAPALFAQPGADGWRVVGMELGLTAATPWAYSVVSFGTTGAEQDAASEVPTRLVLDRSYVHGSPVKDLRRCITLNSANSAIIDSYLSDCHSRDSESQGILGWNGPGPFKIANNRIEGGHEAIVFGGGDPNITNLVPSDVEIRRNHVIRPLSWRGVWPAKNLLELKAGQRVLVEGNVFENNWPDAQTGFAFLWWSINADGGAPWTVTQDITFRYNRVRNVAQGFNVNVGNNPAQPTRRVTIAHNFVTGPDSTWLRMYQIDGGLSGVTIANNTAIGGEHNLMFLSAAQMPSFVFRNNVAGGQYTFYTMGAFGAAAIPFMGIPASNVGGNVFVTQETRMVPSGNAQVTGRDAIGFVDYANGDGRLASSSPYRSAGTGGTLPGADFARLNELTSGVAR
jgi:hypothetical protein